MDEPIGLVGIKRVLAVDLHLPQLLPLFLVVEEVMVFDESTEVDL